MLCTQTNSKLKKSLIISGPFGWNWNDQRCWEEMPFSKYVISSIIYHNYAYCCLPTYTYLSTLYAESGQLRDIKGSWIYNCELKLQYSRYKLISSMGQTLSREITYLLSHLRSVIEHLDPEWSKAFLRRTRFLESDFQGDVLSVLCECAPRTDNDRTVANRSNWIRFNLDRSPHWHASTPNHCLPPPWPVYLTASGIECSQRRIRRRVRITSVFDTTDAAEWAIFVGLFFVPFIYSAYYILGLDISALVFRQRLESLRDLIVSCWPRKNLLESSITLEACQWIPSRAFQATLTSPHRRPWFGYHIVS